MKPGYVTTEFWLTSLLSVWSIFSGVLHAPWNGAIPLIAVGIYTIARGLAKGGVIKGSVGEYLKDK